MRASILFRDVVGGEGTVELASEPVYVGRAAECAIRSEDGSVSRKHAIIRFDEGGYWIEDLGSADGVEIDGARVERHRLRHNDAVRCGSLWLRYVEDPSLPPMPEPRQVLVPDIPEVERLRRHVDELLRQVQELRHELEQARAEQARTAAELESLRRGRQ